MKRTDVGMISALPLDLQKKILYSGELSPDDLENYRQALSAPEPDLSAPEPEAKAGSSAGWKAKAKGKAKAFSQKVKQKMPVKEPAAEESSAVETTTEDKLRSETDARLPRVHRRVVTQGLLQRDLEELIMFVYSIRVVGFTEQISHPAWPNPRHHWPRGDGHSIDSAFNWLKSNYPMDSSVGAHGPAAQVPPYPAPVPANQQRRFRTQRFDTGEHQPLCDRLEEAVEQKILTTMTERFHTMFGVPPQPGEVEMLINDLSIDNARDIGLMLEHRIKVGDRRGTIVLLRRSTIRNMDDDEIMDLYKQRWGLKFGYDSMWWNAAHDLKERIDDIDGRDGAEERLVDLLGRLHQQRQHAKIMAKLNEMDVEHLIMLARKVDDDVGRLLRAQHEPSGPPPDIITHLLMRVDETDIFSNVWGEEKKRAEMIGFVGNNAIQYEGVLRTLVQMEEEWRKYGVEPPDFPSPIESLRPKPTRKQLIEMMYEVAGVNNLDEIRRRLNIDVRIQLMYGGLPARISTLRPSDPVRDVLQHYGGIKGKYKKYRKIKSSRRKTRKAKRNRKAKKTLKARKTRRTRKR